MFRISISQYNGRPQFLTIRSDELATMEEAEALAAIFPKYVKAGASRVSRRYDNKGDYYQVGLSVKFAPTNGNAANETGLKRYRAFRAKAAAHGYAVTFPVYFHADSWMTEQQFEDAVKDM